MARRAPKKTKALEVSVMFESSRIAPACLAQAYERVVPIPRRVVSSAHNQRQADQEEIKQRVGGAQG